MRNALIAAAIATAGSLGLASPAEAQRYPDVRDNRNGDTIVQMSPRCDMVYDYRGDRVHTSRACTGRDIEEAKWVIRRYRHGYRDPSSYWRQDTPRYGRYNRRDRNRYQQSYRTNDYDRYDRRDRYDDRRYGRRIAPASVVGKRTNRGYDMLSSGGYRMISEHPWRGKMESVWFNRSANSCVSVYSRKGKIRAVTGAARQRCVVRY